MTLNPCLYVKMEAKAKVRVAMIIAGQKVHGRPLRRQHVDGVSLFSLNGFRGNSASSFGSCLYSPIVKRYYRT